MSTVRLRHLVQERDRRGNVGEQVLSVYRDHGVVPKQGRVDNFNKTPADTSAYKLVEAGDVVVNKMKAWTGSIAVSDHRGIVSGDYLVCDVFGNVERRYLHHLLRSQKMVQEYVRRSTGIRPQQWRLYWGDFADIRIDLPSREEQRRIADFLDTETARIDALVTAKQQMITQVHARLTAELDSATAVGGFSTAPLRRFVVSITQGTSSQAGTTPAGPDEWGLLKLSAVKNGRFVESENKVLAPDFPVDRTLQPQPGDLLVTRSNTPGYVGDACSIREAVGQVLLPDLIYRVRLDDRMLSQFASMALRSSWSRWQLSSAARGTSQSMVKLRGEDVSNVVIPIPSVDEQAEAVARHDAASHRASSLTATLTRQIELLRERRQALITAAVSGELVV